MRLAAVLLSVVLGSLSPAFGAAGASAGDGFVHYRMVEDDTLYSLGRRFLSVTEDWSIVQRLNGIADPYDIPTGTVVRIPVSLLRERPPAARVEATAGDARIGRKEAEVGMLVAAGERMRTGSDGYLIVALPDGSTLRVPADSTARFQDLRGVRYRGRLAREVNVELERGRVEADVEPQARGDKSGRAYRVTTPASVMGVRGTEFRAAVESPSGADSSSGSVSSAAVSRTEVLTGAVRVTPRGLQGSATDRDVDAGFGLVARAGRSLPEPTRLPPAPGTGGLAERFVGETARFTLPAVAHAAAIRAQISADAARAPVRFERTAAADGSGRIVAAGLAPGDYLLALRSIAANGLEGESAMHRFRVEGRPPTSAHIWPVPDGKVVAGPVHFAWAPVAAAARYRFELATSASFAQSTTHAERVDYPGTRVDLEPGRHFWRVAAFVDGRLGPFSEPTSLQARPIPTLREVVIERTGLVLSWRGDDAQRFEYELAPTRAFDAPLARGRVDAPRAEVTRPEPGDYWVRVRAIDADGFTTPWSTPEPLEIHPSPWWLLILAPVILAV